MHKFLKLKEEKHSCHNSVEYVLINGEYRVSYICILTCQNEVST